MADYKSYLAANILGEDKVVTYRVLSRALKVHVNEAKEMLYEFHRQQNGKKPGTIHATYLISGPKRTVREPEITNSARKDGEDDYMQSSPFISSSMPQPEEGNEENSVFTISLTREEDLETVRSQYEHISSIHIYSLGAHPLKDLQILSDSTREVQKLTSSEEPLESYPKYGIITNPNVKRRANRRQPPAPASANAVKPQAVKSEIVTKKAPQVEQKPMSAQPSSAKDFFGKGKEKPKSPGASAPSSKESTPNPPILKRDSSSIFKSFAKAKPKLQREGTDSSAIASAVEDEPMKDVLDDDEEETYVPPAPSKDIVDSDRKSRKDREAALKKMMEDEDVDEDEDEAAKTPSEQEQDEVDEEVLGAKDKVAEPESVSEVTDGRRRGRRRVMKKKTVKDEEGYLVTMEEATWESFSEDEPAPPPKPKVQPSNTVSKPKKLAGKANQGSIMSFFGKK